MGSTAAPPAWYESPEARFAAVLAAVAAVLIALIVTLGTPGSPAAGESAHFPDHALKGIQQRLKARHRTRSAAAVELACRRHDCACALATAKAGLDADGGQDVIQLLEAAKPCAEQRKLEGMRAEALVRSGAQKDGLAAAWDVLVATPQDPYAVSAVALGAYLATGAPEAIGPTKRAAAAGRGDGAAFLLGLVELALGDLTAARAGFEAVLRSEPQDTDALYNLGVIAQKENRYGEARRLFLNVLRLNPKQKESRFNLGILAHSIGADDEANHDLAKLEAAFPGDPLVARLRGALATPVKPPGPVLKLGGSTLTPGAKP